MSGRSGATNVRPDDAARSERSRSDRIGSGSSRVVKLTVSDTTAAAPPRASIAIAYRCDASNPRTTTRGPARPSSSTNGVAPVSPLPSSHTARAESAFCAVNRSSADRTLSGPAPAITVPMLGAAARSRGVAARRLPHRRQRREASSGAPWQTRQSSRHRYGAETGRGISSSRRGPVPQLSVDDSRPNRRPSLRRRRSRTNVSTADEADGIGDARHHGERRRRRGRVGVRPTRNGLRRRDAADALDARRQAHKTSLGGNRAATEAPAVRLSGAEEAAGSVPAVSAVNAPGAFGSGSGVLLQLTLMVYGSYSNHRRVLADLARRSAELTRVVRAPAVRRPGCRGRARVPVARGHRGDALARRDCRRD